MQKPQAAQKAYSVAISGCSSARLEYTSGGRGVAGSNPVIPTNFFEQTAGFSPAVFFVMWCAAKQGITIV